MYIKNVRKYIIQFSSLQSYIVSLYRQFILCYQILLTT